MKKISFVESERTKVQNENNVPAAVIDDLFGKFFLTMSAYFENGQMKFSLRSQTISSIVYSFSNKNSAPNISHDDIAKRLKVDGGL